MAHKVQPRVSLMPLHILKSQLSSVTVQTHGNMESVLLYSIKKQYVTISDFICVFVLQQILSNNQSKCTFTNKSACYISQSVLIGSYPMIFQKTDA